MFCYADQDDIRSLLFLKRMKFLFGWVFLILSLLCPANARIATQVPFRPIRITTAGTSWTKIVGRPALGISSVTSKTYASKAIQVGIESRMREYRYTTTVRIALNVAGRIQVYPGGLSRGRGEFGPVSGSEYSPERILPGPGRRSIRVCGRYIKV